MRYFVRHIIITALVLMLCVFNNLNSQAQYIMTSDSCVVYVNTDSMIINGSVNNIGSINNDSLYNLGKIIIKGDFVNDGLTSGNGQYELTGDWVNNKVFKSGLSTVTLNGADQFITGNFLTAFYNLKLENAGIKTLTINSVVSNMLDLTDRELATDIFTMFITNVNPLAIVRTSGFVSSLGNGRLSRVTNVNGTYLFPVGSSLDTIRYRPVEIRPNNSVNNTFTVRFVNNKATIDGYDLHNLDLSILRADSSFYHLINRTAGNDSADVTIYFDPVKDGNGWNGIANWKDVPLNQWQNIGYVNSVYGSLKGLKKISWNDYTYEPYVLIEVIHDTLSISGPQVVCKNSPGNYIALGDSNSTYLWTVVGGHIISDSTLDNIWVVWDTIGFDTITVEETTQSGVYLISLPYIVEVLPNPVANFSINTPYSDVFSGDLISFIDQSSIIPPYIINSWFWDFDDGYTLTQENPYHIYNKPGFYNVMLAVRSDNGCTDTVFIDINVKEGLIISNVFTPNGDGVNDYFYFRNSGMELYSLKIFDRWGVLIFKTNNPSNMWDGRTHAGTDAAEGTYYYILEAKSENQEYNRTGFVTLIR